MDQPKAADPLASQRVELISKLAAAQFSLEAVITELERAGASPEAIRSQLQSLGDLQRNVASATSADLAMLRAAINSTVETAQSTAQQARTAAATESGTRDLAGTSARTRATIAGVANDLFERRVFDPYLQFASAEEETEYRRREAERQAYIRAELAKGTPQGALNAAYTTAEQVRDAGAHGAESSPEYDRILRSTTEAIEQQRSAMANGGTSPTSPNVLSASEPTEPLDDVAAALRAAGVVPPSEAVPQGHGITLVQQVSDDKGRFA